MIGSAKELIGLVRGVIDARFSGKVFDVSNELKKKFSDKLGVFVTLNEITGEEENLRGCIGFIEPIFPLWEGVVRGAEAAAFEDPRFVPLDEREWKDIKIEISVLTKPELIEISCGDDGCGKGIKDVERYFKKIDVGVDGLIVENGRYKGLLLPQVAKEYGWNSEEFLRQTCHKAGLDSDAWRNEDTKVYKFQAEIIKE